MSFNHCFYILCIKKMNSQHEQPANIGNIIYEKRKTMSMVEPKNCLYEMYIKYNNISIDLRF